MSAYGDLTGTYSALAISAPNSPTPTRPWCQQAVEQSTAREASSSRQELPRAEEGPYAQSDIMSVIGDM